LKKLVIFISWFSPNTERAQRPLIRIPLGWIALVAAVVFNPISLKHILARPDPFAQDTVTNILIAEAVLMMIGLGCLYPRLITGAWQRTRANQFWHWFYLPSSSGRFWISLIPFFVAALLRQSAVWEATPYVWQQVLFGGVVIESAFSSALLRTGLIALAVKVARHPSIAWITAISLALLDFTDWAFIRYGHIRISVQQMLGSLHAGSSYASVQALLMLCVFLGCGIYSIRTLRSLRMKRNHVFGQRRMAWFAVLLLLSPTGLALRIITSPLPAIDREIMRGHYQEALRLTRPPLQHLARNIIHGNATLTTRYTPEEVAALKPYRGAAPGIAPDPLPGAPFRRIIFITMESLSINFVSNQNPLLPGQLTPTLDSLPAVLTNYRSVAMPTQYGLASHLCGHPNGRGLIQTGHPNALPAYLAAQHWHTAFFQSAPLAFQNGTRRFAELGYQHRFGSEEAAKNPRLTPFISNWGLPDRLVYEEAVSHLEAQGDNPVFLHLHTADTHSPNGRHEYKDLLYPPTPPWINRFPAAKAYLQSWFRADHDLGIFLRDLESRGLMDDHTVILIAGDHQCPMNPVYRSIPRVDTGVFERMPLYLISKRSLAWAQADSLGSQVDTAPTIAQLAGLKPLAGWWGHSLLASRPPAHQLGWRDQQAYTLAPDGDADPAPESVAKVAQKIEVR
jgi:hypothetical protein